MEAAALHIQAINDGQTYERAALDDATAHDRVLYSRLADYTPCRTPPSRGTSYKVYDVGKIMCQHNGPKRH